jgi:DNA primase
MNSDVEEVKNRTNIADLVGEYIRLTKAGSNWRALCPFHNEKTPSFMVSEERGSFHCFGCGKGGDVFSFVMEMEGIGFREALEQLAQKAGVQLKKFEKGNQKEREAREKGKTRLFQILDLATKWYEKNLWEGKGKERTLSYLRGRGLSDETIKKFRLGYSPDGWRNMLDFLERRGYKVEEIARTGLLVEKNNENRTPNTKHYDRFRDRIMFPVQDIMGRVIGFSARVAPGGNEETAKYINTPQTEFYDKSKILYGLHFAKAEIKKRDEAILVEGNMDVIASHQAGIPNIVAVSGTALAPEQVKIIKRYTNNLKMAFDMDSAGQAAAKRSAKICLENDLDVRMVLLPSGKDAADLIKSDKNAWEESVKKSKGIIEYYFDDTFSRFDANNPAEKKKIARELLNVIKDIANPIEQSHWIKVLAEKLGIEEKILADVLRKAKKDRFPSRRANEKAGKEEKKGYFLEKRILGLFLAYPKEGRRQLERIKPDDFSGEKERLVLEAIVQNKENYNLDEIKKLLPDYEIQKLLDEAVFEIEVESDIREKGRQGIFDPTDELKQSLGRLKQRNVKAEIARFSHDIKEAEKKGDRESVKILVEEIRNLTGQIENQ